ncbi:MAG: hypothetical protein LN575_02085 [Rickettsia endosymbiont of Gnoriste bilineata]|nr:hypothetical protein [Rickettsia endosymbiont of Gnoriste bilineata]
MSEKQAITGELAAKDLTIDLGTNQLKYAGNTKLTGELKLHSFYDSSKSVGGNIEIQSNGKLDLSQLDKLLITIAGRTDVNKISDDTKYILISSVDGNGISTLDPSKITLDSISEQNRFVSWTIDHNNLTLHAKDISKEVLEKEFTDKPKEKSSLLSNWRRQRRQILTAMLLSLEMTLVVWIKIMPNWQWRNYCLLMKI